MNNSAQLFSRMGPKKAFSLMKFKKAMRKDTSLLFDDRPSQSQLPKDAFDFFKVEDVTNCQSLLKHVANVQDDGGDPAETSGFLRGFTRLFSGQEDQQSEPVG